MKLAYIISCYKLPDQVISLVNALNSKDSFFMIHIDKKTDIGYVKHLKKQLVGYENVVFLKRHKCYWGDYGHVRATLKAIRYLIEHDIAFDYFNVITGQDYPIKPISFIHKFFTDKTKSYMEFFPLPTKNWQGGGLDRLNRLHIQLGSKKIILPEKTSKYIHKIFFRIPVTKQNGFMFYGGSGYFSLSKKHVKYIYYFLKENKSYERFFRYSYISDEIFFHTILLNSKYSSQVVNNNLRLIDWSGPKEYPTIFRMKDFETIKKSKALFARKFDAKIDNDIIKKINKSILKKA